MTAPLRSMHAVFIEDFSGRLNAGRTAAPEPTDDEVVLDVEYAAVNRVDVLVADGVFSHAPLPLVLGTEAVGTVNGRRVLARGAGLGVRRHGAYAEQIAFPACSLVPVPDGVPSETAAGLGVAGVTAWKLVHDLGRVGGRDRVLVLGASGAVGSLAVQLAAASGAEVWGQSTSEAKAAWIEELGALSLVATEPDVLKRAARELSPTVVIDGLGGPYLAAALSGVATGGRILVHGAAAGARLTIDIRSFSQRDLTMRGYSTSAESEAGVAQVTAKLFEAVASGRLMVRVDDVLPLDQAGRAHDRIRSRSVRGKLLLAPAA